MDSEAKIFAIICGPTGVGKSAVSLELAKTFRGEIINCDSMQVYKGFDIGTDKLLPPFQKDIPHHLLDIVEPASQFTAADFVDKAVDALTEIRERRHLPIIVGGTGLYIKALVEGLFPDGRTRPEIRARLNNEYRKQGAAAMWKRLSIIDLAYAEKIGRNDRARIIRALEVYEATGKPFSHHFNSTHSRVKDFTILKIGLKLDRNVLVARIEHRVDRMFARGLVEEIRGLLRNGVDESAPPFRALGYQHVLRYLHGGINLETAISETKKDTRRYAKRQMTWFRKMEGIQWFDPNRLSDISQYIHRNLK